MVMQEKKIVMQENARNCKCKKKIVMQEKKL